MANFGSREEKGCQNITISIKGNRWIVHFKSMIQPFGWPGCANRRRSHDLIYPLLKIKTEFINYTRFLTGRTGKPINIFQITTCLIIHWMGWVMIRLVIGTVRGNYPKLKALKTLDMVAMVENADCIQTPLKTWILQFNL